MAVFDYARVVEVQVRLGETEAASRRPARESHVSQFDFSVRF